MVTCGIKTSFLKALAHRLKRMSKCCRRTPSGGDLMGGRLSAPGGSHLGSAGGAFQHHLHRLAWHQLHPYRSKLKHGVGRFGALGGTSALGVADGRETITLAKWGETFRCPIELMGASSSVGYLEAVAAGIQARREAETENVTGAAISQQSPSFSAPMASSDCTLSSKATSAKADLAQSFNRRQTLVAPNFITIQQLFSLRTARKSCVKNIIMISVASDRAPPAFGA